MQAGLTVVSSSPAARCQDQGPARPPAWAEDEILRVASILHIALV